MGFTIDEIVMMKSRQVLKMRLEWLFDKILDVIVAACDGTNWYLAMPGAQRPEVLVSELIRVGGPIDKSFRHRMKSMEREMHVDSNYDTEEFERFIESFTAMLLYLGAIISSPAINELRFLIVEFAANVRYAQEHDYSEDVFKNAVREKIEAILSQLDRLHGHLVEKERQLGGEPCCSPETERMVEAVEETKKVAEEVKETVRSTKSIVLKIAKQGKQNLESSTAQAWVLAQFEYYAANPRFCKGVERRKVYARDVWGAVDKEVARRLGITTLDRFVTVRDNAQRNRKRRENAKNPRSSAEETAGTEQ